MTDSSRENHDRSTHYEKDSLSLAGAVSLGTGVMIGAGIFALIGQIAELAGGLFPYAVLAAAVVSGFSAYTYVKMDDAYPSAGGTAMFLKKAYGKTTMTGACALLMYFSMVISESLVTAIVLDVVVLGAFLWVKSQSDMLVIWASLIGLVLVFAMERIFLRSAVRGEDPAG